MAETAKPLVLNMHEQSMIGGECENLVYRYLHFLETDQSKTADLFTEDGDAFGHIGRDVIREFFLNIEKTDKNVNVVLSSNLLIEVVDQNHSIGTGYVTHYASEPVNSITKDPKGRSIEGELYIPKSITRWTWQFKRANEDWLISKLDYPYPVLFRKDLLDTL